ncbi:unnamed protein product [Diamesa tonsa]
MAGISLHSEIYEISEKPEKCIGYPIGSQLDKFVRSQANEPDFILCASVLKAAAKIYSRNVDYILQEAYGISDNLSKHQETDKDNPTIVKKTRVKKYVIKDKVSVFAISFDLKVINVQEKKDINKTLTMPSKLTKLRQIREFYSKNKQNNGKLAMPKSCQLINDTAAMSSTFGTNIIYDYDQSDVVGSRKDFASHCNIIDPYSGELLKDLCFNNSDVIRNMQNINTPSNQQPNFMSDNEDSLSHMTTNDEANNCSLPPINDHYNPDLTDAQQSPVRLTSPLSINLDEGIDVTELDILLTSPRLSVNVLKLSTSQEMIDNYLNTKKNMECSNSLLTNSFYEVRESILNSPTNFVLPNHIKIAVADCRLRNILMIPLQKLKHKCAFDLPANEYMVHKKMKLNQHKSTVEDVSSKRMFKTIDCSKASEIIRECSVALDSPPCFGFSNDELEESPQTVHETTPLQLLIKSEDDELRARSRSRTPTGTLCPHRQSSDSFDSGLGNDSINITDTMIDFGEDLDRTKRTDSCYQSMVSGMSGLSNNKDHFLDCVEKEISFDYSDETSENVDNFIPLPVSSIVEMQKLATNVARWRQFLKPVLDQAETQNHFDIHQYGSMIINKVEKISQTSHDVSFEDVVEVGETPRYFLSMLQLLNSGNLEVQNVSTQNIEPAKLSDIKMKLLSRVRHNKIVENIGSYLPGAINQLQLPQNSVSQKRKKPIDMHTSTPATKKQILQIPSSSHNDSLGDESGYCSFDNSQSLQI